MPPHSIDAEQAVLGGLMLAPDALDKVADRLAEDDFYRKDHRLIWRAINELANKGMPCDAVTLGDWFEANGLAEMVGGASYLIELANTTPSAANIGAYADIVREKSVLRQLIDAGTSITEDGFRPEGKSVQEVLESAEQRVFQIAESGARGKKDSVSMREAVKDAFRVLTERYENKGQLTGLSTGFTDLDELTSGLQPSDLIIVAARPSMGKTAFSVNIAESAALARQEGGGDFLDGNVVLAAGVAPDLLDRPHPCAAPAQRRPQRGGLAARHQRDHHPVRREDLHRRHARRCRRWSCARARAACSASTAGWA